MRKEAGTTPAITGRANVFFNPSRDVGCFSHGYERHCGREQIGGVDAAPGCCIHVKGPADLRQGISILQVFVPGVDHKGHGTVIFQGDLHVSTKFACLGSSAYFLAYLPGKRFIQLAGPVGPGSATV